MTSQTTSSQNGEPRERAILAGVRKIPTPITSPMTSAVTDASPSWRESASGVVGSGMGDVSSLPRLQRAREAAALSLNGNRLVEGPNHEPRVTAVGGGTRPRPAPGAAARGPNAPPDG